MSGNMILNYTLTFLLKLIKWLKILKHTYLDLSWNVFVLFQDPFRLNPPGLHRWSFGRVSLRSEDVVYWSENVARKILIFSNIRLVVGRDEFSLG